MRIEGRRCRDEWLPNFYPAHEINPDHHLRLSRVGTVQILSAEQNAQLDEIFMEEALFQRLQKSGHIVTAENSRDVLDRLRRWHQRTYAGPDLHIVVLTKRCNLDCTYCHMDPVAIGADPGVFDMQPDVADSVIRFALSTPSPILNFEFQGGEPFLNFDGMVHFVTEAMRQKSSAGKEIDFSVVSNLMVIRDEHMEFCREHGVTISYSLNGPQDVHDRFRISRSGTGSYRAVLERLHYLQEKYPGVLSSSPLCVVGADNAKDLIRTIDFFHAEGFKGVAILKLKHLGNAVEHRLAFDMEEFLRCYLEALDHIYEKNRQLFETYSERTLKVLLAKVICDSDVGFVDWRNPVGDFSCAITYDYDGEILPSDEARSLRPAFALGNVKERTYDELIRRRETFQSMNLSLRDRDPVCRECGFNPYCGVLPVLDYARTGDPTPRAHESEECLQTIAVLTWMFRKLVEDPLPLFRMLPDIDGALLRLLEQARQEEVSQ